MDLQLRGKRAVITGGTKGIGRAIAEILTAEGADVAICARDEAGVQSALAALSKGGGKAIGNAVDVANGEAVRSWIDRMAAELGGPDIVVPNVSAGGGGRTGLEAWRANFEIDILGTVNTVEASLPYLEKSGGGAIALISSTAAVEVFRVPQPYNVMKAGLINYAKNLAYQYAPKNIRVNCVSPGPIFVEGGGWDRTRKANPDVYNTVLGQIPMGRMGTAAEVASAIAYLCCPLASFVTGANLIIDGGFTKRVNF
jgi:NAD(P)-dependent dehydrogenase (short-subunit alcohol dehydrogenase family)